MPSNLVRALVATVVGVLLLPLAGVNAPAYAAVGTPVLTSPVNDPLGKYPVTANPVLSWNRLTGASRYEVQVASTSAFLAPLKFSSSTLNSRATPPADLAIGSWWWRVRAFDSANVAGAYAVSTFSKEAANKPDVLTPINSAVLQYPTEPLVFSWNPMAGVKTYEVQIDDDALFVGAPLPFATNNTRYVPISPPPFNMPFYWHVRGVSAQGVPTQWSEPQSYQMTWANLPPILTAPPSTNTDTIEEIVLDWQPVIGASAYQLQISPDDQFNAPIGGTRVVRATTFAPNPTLPNGAYFWRVRALSTSAVPEPGVWSDSAGPAWTFTRAWPSHSGTQPSTRPRGTDGAGDGLLPQVQLLLPRDDPTDAFPLSEPNFTWAPQREASNYQFDVGTDPNFSPGPPSTFGSCLTNHTAFTPYSLVVPGAPSSPWCSPVKLVPGRVLYWRVKALDGLVNGVWSEVRQFRLDPSLAPIPQTSPTSGSTVNGAPVLRWQGIDNSPRYKVTIEPSDAACAKIEAFTNYTGYVPETLPTTCVGPIAWTVQAVKSSGALSRLAIQSSWPTFTLGTQPSPGGSVEPVVMTDLDGGPLPFLPVNRFAPPLMRWTPVTGATRYTVFASVAGANSYQTMNISTGWPAFIYTGENSTLGLLAGDYDFYIEAYSAASVLLSTSAVRQFHVERDVGSTLITPADCLPGSCTVALYDTPTLDWSPVPGAGLYLVYLAEDPNFTNITRTWWAAYSQLTPLESLPDRLAGQATYWFIRPCITKTACSAFDTDVFPRAHAFRKTSAPIDGYTTIQANTETHDPCALLVPCADEVTFTWKDYLATNNALTPVVTQEARNYQVQVSTTATFTNIIDTSPFVDQTTYTAQTITYPDGPLFWRVRAYDNADDTTGNPLTFSQANGTAFTKSSAEPVLQLPLPGSEESEAPLLTWDPMPFTNTYAVEIYKNPSAPLATANRVASIITRSTRAIPTVTLPKGDYGWRVQRLDVNGKAGPWPPLDNLGLRLFKVQGPTPALLAPPNCMPLNCTPVETTTLVLQWAPAAGASRYLAEASTSPSFTSMVESVTTDMTAWAPGQISPAWPNATIYWRVWSLDATGQRLTTLEPPAWSIAKNSSTSGEFTPMTPTRLLDTRITKRPIGSGATLTFDVTGALLSGVPASGVSAVVMNVTATGPTTAGSLTVYPSNVARPSRPNLYFAVGQTVPNLVTVGVDTSGRVNIFNSAGSTHLILDIVGYYSVGTLQRATRFVPAVRPTRILDTRGGGGVPARPLRAAEARLVEVAGLGGVPAGATSVVMNITAVAPTAAGYLTVYPAGVARPTASNLNFVPNVTVPNLVSVRLGTGGDVNVFNFAGQTHVLVDVVGWYVAGDPGAGARFTPLNSGLVLDTRLAGSGGKLAALTPRGVQIRGVQGVPSSRDVIAVVLTVTVTQPVAPGYATVYPSLTTAPTASNLNYLTGKTISNLVVVTVGDDGKINLVSHASAHMIVSVAGWFGG